MAHGRRRGQQVLVGEHRALRHTGGARRVHDEGEVLVFDLGQRGVGVGIALHQKKEQTCVTSKICALLW